MDITYIYDNDIVNISKIDPTNASKKLKPLIYTIIETQAGFCLKIVNQKFKLPEKFYGPIQDRENRICKSYESRDSSLGILLTGLKGTGKSLLAKKISNVFLEEKNLPVILITQAFSGDSFFNVINSLGECVLVFDEFAKVYGRHENQASLLSLFDGVNSDYKRLIILTENNAYDVCRYFKNRPGRILYHYKYSNLDVDTVKEYCIDHGVPENLANELASMSSSIVDFNFDILQALVDDYKIHREPKFYNSFKHLNVEFIDRGYTKFKVSKLYLNDKEVKFKQKRLFEDFIGNGWNTKLRKGYLEFEDEKIEKILFGEELNRGFSLDSENIIERREDKYVLERKLEKDTLIFILEEDPDSKDNYMRKPYLIEGV